MPNSEVMIHQPLGGMQGQASDIMIAANHISKTKDKMIDLFAKMTGKDKEQIAKDIDRDNYMSADEAKKYGLIDKVIDKRK